MTFRYAIWAAVSTETQATADKISLPDQERKCRSLAESRGWRETAGPFILPGESRTRWVNLRDAENEIPELRLMLDAAQGNLYDLLVMYDYNRLRDLLGPVSKTLSHYGVQIFSLSQPVEPLLPQNFSPYASDASTMMQGLAQIISQAQISDLRRKYAIAMPLRVSQRGLPVQIPFGYRKPPGRETDRSVVPVQDTDRCDLLIKAKDALLDGQSLSQLVPLFENSGFSPPGNGQRWYPETIKSILSNPFYAGVVRFGVTKSKLDPRTGRRFREKHIPDNQTVTGIGKHEPLWDMVTHHAILTEITRRGKNYRGRKNNQFTGLLECGQCGKRLWTFYHSNYGMGEPIRVWRCSSRESHIVVAHSKMVTQVADRLVDAIRKLANAPPAEIPPDVDYVEIEDLHAQRKRLEDAYQAGALGLPSFVERTAVIDEQLNKAQRKASLHASARQDQITRLSTLHELAGEIDNIPAYLAEADPTQVNHMLHMLLEKVIVRGVDDIELVFK